MAYIYELSLRNIQKYKESVFRFAKGGNLIVGINGSGKSSILSGIVLALGGTPKILGKNLNVSELIRFGDVKGVIRIVLYTEKIKEVEEIIGSKLTPIHEDNPNLFSITRTITGGSSMYCVNKIQCQLVTVKSICAKLNIQIDTLCQILPQDKVNEFIRLSEEEQLEMTLNACAPELIDQKNQLHQIETKAISLSNQIKTEETVLKDLREHLDKLQEESCKLKEILQRQETIKLLEGKIKWVEYKHLKLQLNTLNQALAEKQNEYQRQEQSLQKKQKKHKEELAKYTALETSVDTLVNDGRFAQLLTSLKTIERTDTEIQKRLESIKTKKEAIQIEEKETKEYINEKQEIEPPRNQFSSAQQRRLDEIEAQLREEQAQENAWHLETAIKVSEIRQLELRLKEEENKEAKQMDLLKTIHRDTYTTVRILKESKKDWQVTLPAILTMNVIKEEFLEELSSQLSIHALTSFICHTPESFQEFVKEFKDKHGLAVNAVERQVSQKNLEDRPEIDKKYKMTYLSECIDGPEDILVFLNAFSRLSHVPVTKVQLSNEMEFFQEYPKVSRFISNKRMVELKRSRYTTDTILVVYPISRGAQLISKETDNQALKDRIELLKEEREIRSKDRQEAITRRQVLEKQQKELKALETYDRQEIEKYHRYKRSIAAFKSRLKELETDLSLAEKNEQEQNSKLESLREEEKQIWKQLSKYKLENTLLTALDQIKASQSHKTTIDQLEVQILEEKTILEKIHNEILMQQEEYQKKEKETKKKMKEAEEIINPTTPELKSQLNTLPKEISLLSQQLELEKAKSNLAIANPTAIEDYHKSKDTYRETEKRFKLKLQEHSILSKERTKLESTLKTSIASLIDCINTSSQKIFSQAKVQSHIGVLFSEVSVSWKLQIKVQFRSNAPLELLTPGRQSGGEKSVSIILYLLSIQQYSRASFMIVDEINQGMDAVHEKSIHSILLGPNRTINKQTIVITPKLVPNLEYSSDTCVHVILELPV
ncbi:structural maintenance of chromosomes protein 5 [Nematocida sp. AWRm80]|nr:structural maintenance of chromosomes protein 5 [Nematocida sp. AWRm80]